MTEAALILLSMACGAVLVVHSACMASTWQWRLREPVLWCYAGLGGGGLYTALGPVWGHGAPPLSAVVINASVVAWIAAGWLRRRRRTDTRRPPAFHPERRRPVGR